MTENPQRGADRDSAPPDQLVLVRGQLQPAPGGSVAGGSSAATGSRSGPARGGSSEHDPDIELPVARVLVDVGLAHLDRPFDYRVTAEQDEAARPGCRVRVRFSGQDVDGYVLERAAGSGHRGRLAPLRRVVSTEPVLTPEVAALCRAVADRYAGVLPDVLRLAVPPRHARVEREPWTPAEPPAPVPPEGAEPRAGRASGGEPSGGPHPSVPAWQHFPGGPALLRRLGNGESPRAVWVACPGTQWTAELTALVESAAASGRGVLVCLPDARDVARLVARLEHSWVAPRTVSLTADLGPARRYRGFLRVVRGEARVVVGTRAAMFAPVRDLGLAVVWDDGDDLHAEPRAPYPHTREVLALRARLENAAFVCGGFAMTAEGAALVESGWAAPVVATRPAVRSGAPRIHVTGESDSEQLRDPAARAARLPSRALEVAREALRSGPVLVQVPRGGYLPALACVRCRRPARCARCHGPLAMRSRGQRIAACGWCGRPALHWRCAECGADRYRAPVVGSQRTAEELGRSFAGVQVVGSAAGRVRDTVSDRPALVVCTPGAEPVADGGYAAALLLDTWLTLSRPGLRTAEEALRRWLGAAALVRPAGDGGRVVVVGDPALPGIQALVRWDPQGAAERELAERRAAHLPPAARLAVLSGPVDEIEGLRLGRTPGDGLPENAADDAGGDEGGDEGVGGNQPRDNQSGVNRGGDNRAGADAAGAIGAGSDATGSILPEGTEVLGPLPVTDESARLVVRVPPAHKDALSRALKVLQATRSARKLPHLRVEVDPVELG